MKLNKFYLKGSGLFHFHLGCGFKRDKYGILCMNPGQYMQLREEMYKRLFGEKPQGKERSPLVKGDHSELYTLAFLNKDETEIYQSLVGSIQWTISIGCWYIQCTVMMLSSFQVKP